MDIIQMGRKSQRRKLSVLSYPRARLAAVCTGPWLRGTLEWMVSERLWGAGYREPAARCPLRLPSRFGIQWWKLVGCLDDLRLKSTSPPTALHPTSFNVHVQVCAVVHRSAESPFRDSGCNRYWLSVIRKDAERRRMRMKMLFSLNHIRH